MTWQDIAKRVIEQSNPQPSGDEELQSLSELVDNKRIADAQHVIEQAGHSDTGPELQEVVVAPAEEGSGEAESDPPPPLVATTDDPGVPSPVQPQPDDGMPAELVDVPEETVPDAQEVVTEASHGEDAAPAVIVPDDTEDAVPGGTELSAVPDSLPVELIDTSVAVTEAKIPDGSEVSMVPQSLPFDFEAMMEQLNRTVELPPTSIVEDAGTALELPPVPELIVTTEHAEAALSQMGQHLRSLERRRP
jgi:hypothetical protein